MNYEVYTDFTVSHDHTFYDFLSIGKHGSILKRLAFDPTKWINVYNLVFGDVNESDEIDDLSVTNNGDRNKILATIATIVDDFTGKYPYSCVYFMGSTSARTRLYRMAIGINVDYLSHKFDIYMELEDSATFVPFQQNTPAKAFLIKRKTN